VKEGEKKRQKAIVSEPYSSPIPKSPPWTFKQKDPHPRGG
jgi:hypothetical protein